MIVYEITRPLNLGPSAMIPIEIRVQRGGRGHVFLMLNGAAGLVASSTTET